MKSNIPKNATNAKCVREAFAASGISVAEWARARGFSTDLVYQVLDGRRQCLRGQSHRIAVALGLKDGNVMTVEQLSSSLKENKTKLA